MFNPLPNPASNPSWLFHGTHHWSFSSSCWVTSTPKLWSPSREVEYVQLLPMVHILLLLDSVGEFLQSLLFFQIFITFFLDISRSLRGHHFILWLVCIQWYFSRSESSEVQRKQTVQVTEIWFLVLLDHTAWVQSPSFLPFFQDKQAIDLGN